jgi:NAD(P)-dependent dehydrogenase (short-subunit alcohol dehydrogenase family)
VELRLLATYRMDKKQRAALAVGALAAGGALIARGVRKARAIEFEGRSVVITGGSRGLGLVIARQFGEAGAHVTIAARNAAELDRARDTLAERGVDVSTVVCDLTVRSDALRLIDDVVTRHGRVDVLVNNAGVMTVAPIDHMTPGDFEEAMAVHFWGPLHTMLAAADVMRRHGGGRIVNISSIGGKVGVPHMVPYCASKFALSGLSDAIRGELARDRIYVTTVCPGLMRTGSPFNAWFKGRHRAEFTWFAISDSLPLVSIDAERAAAQVIDACRHGDAELVITWPARLAVIANAVMPEAVALGMNLVNRFVLPARDESGQGDQPHSGWQSLSSWAPSWLTRLTERAAAANNELPVEGR